MMQMPCGSMKIWPSSQRRTHLVAEVIIGAQEPVAIPALAHSRIHLRGGLRVIGRFVWSAARFASGFHLLCSDDK